MQSEAAARGNPCARETNRRQELAASEHSTGYVWYVIFLLSLVNAFNYMDRMALAVLAPLIKSDLHFSDSELGMLTGFAFALFYAACGIPIARWADRGTRRNIIALALTTWSVMTALSGVAKSFWHLFAARVGVAAGEAGCIPPAQSMICDYVRPERRPGVFSIHMFGQYAGLMLGMVLAGWLGQAIGWRWTFIALGLPGVAVAVLVSLTLREPVRGFFDTRQDTKSRLSFGQAIRNLWGCATYRWLVLFIIVNAFVNFGLNQWWPSFYTRVFGLNLASVGIYLGVALGVGMGVGLLIGGSVANKAARRDVGLPLKLGAVATALAIPVAVVSLFVSSATISIALVSVAVLLWTASHGPVTAALYSVALPEMRATAGSFAIFLASLLGIGLGPIGVGFLSDYLSPSVGSQALRYALLLPIGLLPVMVIALYGASRKLSADLNAGGAQVEQ